MSLAIWTLEKSKDGTWKIEGTDLMLIAVYDAGDCDTRFRLGSKAMHRALYDLVQIDGRFKDSDIFAYQGEAIFRVHGFHVEPCLRSAVPEPRAAKALPLFNDLKQGGKA